MADGRPCLMTESGLILELYSLNWRPELGGSCHVWLRFNGRRFCWQFFASLENPTIQAVQIAFALTKEVQRREERDKMLAHPINTPRRCSK